jgi:hypothetical protein
MRNAALRRQEPALCAQGTFDLGCTSCGCVSAALRNIVALQPAGLTQDHGVVAAMQARACSQVHQRLWRSTAWRKVLVQDCRAQVQVHVR